MLCGLQTWLSTFWVLITTLKKIHFLTLQGREITQTFRNVDSGSKIEFYLKHYRKLQKAREIKIWWASITQMFQTTHLGICLASLRRLSPCRRYRVWNGWHEKFWGLGLGSEMFPGRLLFRRGPFGRWVDLGALYPSVGWSADECTAERVVGWGWLEEVGVWAVTWKVCVLLLLLHSHFLAAVDWAAFLRQALLPCRFCLGVSQPQTDSSESVYTPNKPCLLHCGRHVLFQQWES